MTTEPNKTALTPDAATIEATAAPAKQQQAQPESGNWFHRNRWFTKEPITYTGYQMFRSAMAAIPYGFGMAGVRHLFAWGEIKGLAAGLTEEGKQIIKANPSGRSMAAIDKLATTDPAQYALMMRPGMKGMLGRSFARFASSPFQTATQIGVSFTMFRFVGGLIKTVRDKVMDENNTPQDTVRETKNALQTIKDTAKTNWPAESTATPWAALTLGYATANYVQTPQAKPQRMMLANGAKETFGAAVKRTFSNPHSKLAQQAAIWTIAYSAFFEIAERLFKDTQIRRGLWKGHHNSLKNAPGDATVGTPPDEQSKDQPPAEKPKHAWLTQDPSLGRLMFRRVLPVAVGITGYAIAKRIGYIAAGGQMEHVTEEIINGGLKSNMNSFLTNAWREGAATATFGVLWMATDAWANAYDKFFAKLQDKASHEPLNEHQAKNVAALHEKLLAKESAHGRVA